MSMISKTETNRFSSCDPSCSSVPTSRFKTEEELLRLLERILPPIQYVPPKTTVGSRSYEELLHLIGSR